MSEKSRTLTKSYYSNGLRAIALLHSIKPSRCNAKIVYLLKVLVEKVDSSIAFEALDAISFVVLAFLSFYYILSTATATMSKIYAFTYMPFSSG